MSDIAHGTRREKRLQEVKKLSGHFATYTGSSVYPATGVAGFMSDAHFSKTEPRRINHGTCQDYLQSKRLHSF